MLADATLVDRFLHHASSLYDPESLLQSYEFLITFRMYLLLMNLLNQQVYKFVLMRENNRILGLFWET